MKAFARMRYVFLRTCYFFLKFLPASRAGRLPEPLCDIFSVPMLFSRRFAPFGQLRASECTAVQKGRTSQREQWSKSRGRSAARSR
jgi:hypothetical protein